MVLVQEEECKSRGQNRDSRNITMNIKTYGTLKTTGERMTNDARATRYHQEKKSDL